MNTKQAIIVEEERLNQLWLEFLEGNILWFLLKEISEEYIEKYKTVSFIKLIRYMDNFGLDKEILCWDVRLVFGYNGEWICVSSVETDPKWECSDWSDNSKESLDITQELEGIFSGRKTNLILNQFLETVLNEEYKLGIQ